MGDLKFFIPMIERAAAKHGLQPEWVKAIVMVESSAQTDAFRYEPQFWLKYLASDSRYRGENPRRVAASYGLMQVMFPTAQEHGFSGPPEGLFVPEIGLEWGCKILASMLHWSRQNFAEADTLRNALAAFNAGRAGWDSQAGQRYAEKVLGWLSVIADRNAGSKNASHNVESKKP